MPIFDFWHFVVSEKSHGEKLCRHHPPKYPISSPGVPKTLACTEDSLGTLNVTI